jgi:hypothetical protein
MLLNFLFLLLRSSCSRKADVKKGTFLCPHCNSSQPCKRYDQVRGQAEFEASFVQCDTCTGKQKADNFHFNPETSVFDPVLWECFYYQAKNPNDTFRCRQCHKSLV